MFQNEVFNETLFPFFRPSPSWIIIIFDYVNLCDFITNQLIQLVMF